jgi:flagellar L-ring protein precursor FlgH
MKSCTPLLVLGLAAPALLPAQAAVVPPPAEAAPAPVGRLSWTSDRLPLRVGDLLTIVVDENTVAAERQSNVANNTRSQGASLDALPAPEDLRNIGIGYDARSNQTGRVERAGSLVSVLSVRVTAIEPNGIARIEGQKIVVVDGRRQEVLLTGVVRSEDVSASNAILSSRIADAEITYKGKKLGPSTGIFGKILGLLWP